jgi:hypothetical protein
MNVWTADIPIETRKVVARHALKEEGSSRMSQKSRKSACRQASQLPCGDLMPRFRARADRALLRFG